MTNLQNNQEAATAQIQRDSDGVDLIDVALSLAPRWKLLVFGPVLGAIIAIGLSFLVTPTFTAKTVFLPPQQQSSASAALASLGALANLAGAGTGKSSADQYIAMMQSTTVSDRLIDTYNLQMVYEKDYRSQARLALADNVRMSAGRRDGLITVEFDDIDPVRAAKVANSYVEELRWLTSTLAVTEAQQRRVFFEGQLKSTREKLVVAQQALVSSGFSAGAIKAEPKAAAEAYAKLKAQETLAEVRVQTLRGSLSDASAEVQQAMAAVDALRAQLAKQEAPSAPEASPGLNYVGKYRDFRYQETLFDLLARQLELAKVDEAREGALIQVVDTATTPDRKSKPKRSVFALVGLFGSVFAILLWLLVSGMFKRMAQKPHNAMRLTALRRTWHRG